MLQNAENEFKLPPIEMDPISIDEEQNYSVEYGEISFNAEKQGFNDWKFLGFLPYRKSIDVLESPIGVGYEVLDRDKYDFSKTLPLMKNSGVKWARIQSGWNKTEKEKDCYDFAWLDEIIDGLLDIGIVPWISISYGNALYTVNENAREGYITDVPLHYGDDAIQGWENYVSALTEHYNERVFHWEVWNEPNTGFWGQEPDPVEYVEFVKITSKQIRKHQQSAKIIGGAISAGACCNQYINGLISNNISEYIDIFSYHPYGLHPESNIEQRFKYIKNAFDATGKKIEIWQGECGRPSASVNKSRGWKLTTANQARYLTRRIITDLRIGFAMTSYFLVADLNGYGGGGDNSGGFHHQGIIDSINYRPKPAFYALQSMAYLFDSETKYIEDACFEVYSDQPYQLTSIYEHYAISAGFLRGNIPIYSYYSPENIDIDYGCKKCSINIWQEPGTKFEKPILIDPITRKVYVFKHELKDVHQFRGVLRFLGMPLLDYPLFISDVSLIKKLEKERE
jgi:polysaccharide biosynthesis protein PslG